MSSAPRTPLRMTVGPGRISPTLSQLASTQAKSYHPDRRSPLVEAPTVLLKVNRRLVRWHEDADRVEAPLLPEPCGVEGRAA
jgi:hypothetical protein